VSEGQSIHSMGLVWCEVRILAQRATTLSKVLCVCAIHIFSSPGKKEPCDGVPKRAFILLENQIPTPATQIPRGGGGDPYQRIGFSGGSHRGISLEFEYLGIFKFIFEMASEYE
jgi:hypothetical protein